jgi:hypothetical protein
MDDKKLVTIWLTNADQKDPCLVNELSHLYEVYAKKKYKVAEFHSGTEDLYANTRDLLLFNRKRMAEKEIQTEKMSKQAGILTGHSDYHKIQCQI